ncbi:MAG TPA: serine/threonine-protein kinase [Nonomuraea sp.]|nr:serine/threonine-protein kinase [Nonomuraea sp.]
MDSTASPTDPPDPSSHEPALLGRTLGGSFRVLEQVGATSAGLMYRAEDTTTGVEVTLLLLRAGPEREAPPEDSARLAPLLQHLRRASEIHHPNVAAVLRVEETPDGLAYAVLESLQGELLAEILAARQALPLSEAVHLILQVAAGLQAAHEAGVVHGCLSPATILITRAADERFLVKLIHFAPPDKSLSTEYTSPERLAGHPPDVSGDVFSLGAVLHHLLTGTAPGGRMTPAKPVPSRVRPILEKALAASPADRFQTVAEFAAALRGLEIRRARTRALTSYVIAACVGVAVALAGVGLWWGSQQRGDRGASESAMAPSAQADTANHVVAAAGQPMEGTWRLVAQRVGEQVLRPPQAEGFFRVRDGVVLLELRRTVGDTLFEYYGSGGYSGSADRFSYGYDRMVWVTRRPARVTVLDTIQFEAPRVFQAHSVRSGVRYEADSGHYVLEVVGDTLSYGEAGAWVRRWIRVRPTRSRP